MPGDVESPGISFAGQGVETTMAEQFQLPNGMFSISPELTAWVNSQRQAGRTDSDIMSQMRRVIGVLQPLRDAEAPVAENVSRTETEFNLNWAKANPELFAQAVDQFQNKTPITHWQHFVDLSRRHFMKLIAVRRDKPFDSVTDYVMEDKLYLRETGFAV